MALTGQKSGMNEALRSSPPNVSICASSPEHVQEQEQFFLYALRGQRSAAARHVSGHAQSHACAFEEALPLMV